MSDTRAIRTDKSRAIWRPGRSAIGGGGWTSELATLSVSGVVIAILADSEASSSLRTTSTPREESSLIVRRTRPSCWEWVKHPTQSDLAPKCPLSTRQHKCTHVLGGTQPRQMKLDTRTGLKER